MADERITCPECGKNYWRCYIAGIPVSGHLCQQEDKSTITVEVKHG